MVPGTVLAAPILGEKGERGVRHRLSASLAVVVPEDVPEKGCQAPLGGKRAKEGGRKKKGARHCLVAKLGKMKYGAWHCFGGEAGDRKKVPGTVLEWW